MMRVVIGVVILLVGVTACASNSKLYRNDKMGFEISSIEGWEQSQIPGNPTLFIKRKSVAEPGIISVNIVDFAGDKDDFMHDIKTNPRRFVEIYKQRFPSAEMIKSGDIILGGLPGYYITTYYMQRSMNDVTDVIAMQIFCVKGKKVYLVNFEVPLLLFDETYKEFQEILATFNYL